MPDFVKLHPEWWILLAVLAANSLIHFVSLAAYRYFLINIPLLMVLTVMAVFWIWSWLTRWIAPWIPAAILVILLAFQIDNGLENLKTDRSYRSGIWLKKQFSDLCRRDGRLPVVWFTDASGEWFWSGFDRAVPIETGLPDWRTFQGFDLVIVRNRDPENKLLRERTDLVEVETPSYSTIKVYRKR